MTTIGQTAQSYQHMLALASGQRQMVVATPPLVGYTPYGGNTLQQFMDYSRQVYTNIDAGIARGPSVTTSTGTRVVSLVNGLTGGSYTDTNAAKADFQLLQQASARPPFNGNVDAYMTSLIAFSQANPSLSNQPLTLESLNSANFFTWSEARINNASASATSGAPTGAPSSATTGTVRPDGLPATPVALPPALNTAVTNFLTGDATAAEITALKGAVNVTDSNPPGQLHGRGGVNGADTMVATRTALGGPLSATNHPELYALASTRYTQLTGLPADRAATPAEIDAAEARVRAMTPEQRAEYQSVSYLLGANETALPNGKINVDGIYGPRTEASVAAGNTAVHPAAAVPVDLAAGPATGAEEPAAPVPLREVVLDMSGENSRGDRERLINITPPILETELNKNGGNFRVVVFNPEADRNGPQTLSAFVATRPPGTVVGVMGIREDGIRGGREFTVSSVPQATAAATLPTVNVVVTDDALRGDQRQEFPRAIESAVGSLRSSFTPAALGTAAPLPPAVVQPLPQPRVEIAAPP